MRKENFIRGEMVSIYTNDDEWFGVGYVFGTDDSFIILKSIDTAGEDDGITLYRLDEIVKVERNTQYIEKLKKLGRIKNIRIPKYDATGCDLDTWLLEKSKSENTIVQLQLLQSGRCDVSGIVKELRDGVCVISQIDELGNDDGECSFHTADISSIKLGSRESRDIMLIRQNS